MIYNLPFFSSPFYKNSSYKNRYNYYTNYHPNSCLAYKIYNQNYASNSSNNTSYAQNIQKSNSISPQSHSKKVIEESYNNSYKDDEIVQDEIFEIFGLKLYFDDILLICLIFFLYTEGVKDSYLFISLILLLLS